LSGSGRSDLVSRRSFVALTDSSPVLVLKRALGADDVAQVPVLEGLVALRLAERVVGHVELDAAAHVLQRGEARLAHHALEHHPAVGLGLLASAALLGISWWANSLPYSQLWLLALAAPFLLLVPTATGLWLGEGRMWPINAAQVAAPASVLAGLMGAWWLLHGTQRSSSMVLLVLTAWVSGKSLVAVITAIQALRDADRRDEAHALSHADVPQGRAFAPTPRWWSDWRFVATIGLTNVVSLLNYRASLFLVERFHGLNTVGTYSVAVTVAELLWVLSSSVTVSVYGRIGHPDMKVAADMTVRAVRINVIATLLAAPVLMGVAWWALPWAMGAAYEDSLMPLAALLPGVAAYAAASSLSAFYTNHLGRPQLSGAIAGLSLTVSFGLGWVLVPVWGALGAGVASSLGYIIAIAVAYGVFLRHAGLPLRALWRSSSVASLQPASEADDGV
jgi:O-antigen/teichoic acid export membrane protein